MTNIVSAMEELASLDRLLTRLALTEDDKLEKVLSKLLPLAIGRLSSPHEATRNKVMEMLTHINNRIRDQASIKIPLQDLLTLYRAQTSATSPLVFNFAMVYVEMAFERASEEARLAVVPDLLEGIASRPVQHQYMLLRCAALGLEPYGSNRGVLREKLAEQYSFIKSAEDSKLWLEYSLYTLLYRPPAATPEGGTAPVPGLSVQQTQWVAGNAKQKAALQGEKLATRKLALINFNVGVDFSNAQLYPHFLVGASDSNDRVSRRGEELLKRRAGSLNLDDPNLMRRLFTLYQGSGTDPGPAETKIAPASVTLKMRLMSVFTHSTAAANCFPATLQVVFDSIYGAGTTMRLKQAGMEFAVWVFKHATEDQLKPMAPVILAGGLKLLDQSDVNDPDKAVQQLRAFTYQAIGQLAKRAPHLFSGSANMAVRLFGALRQEGVATRSILQEAVTTLSAAYENVGDKVRREVEALLLENVSAAEDAARFCAVQWTCRLFPPTHAVGRYICMIGCGDKKLEIREMAERALFPADTASSSQPPELPQLPSLADILTCIVQQRPQVTSPARVGEQALIFPAPTYAAMLRFLQLCWQAERSSPSSGPKPPGREAVAGAEVKGVPESSYRLLLEHAMARDGTWALHAAGAQGLMELAAAHPQEMAKEYAGRLAWLKQFVGHSDGTTREAVSRLVGITSEALAPDPTAQLLEELLKAAKADASGKGRLEEEAGGVSAAGYLLAQASTGTPALPPDLLRSTTATLAVLLRDAPELLAATAGDALGHIGLRGPLPLPRGDLPCPRLPPGGASTSAAAASAAAAAGVGGGAGGGSTPDSGPEPKSAKPAASRAGVVSRMVALLEESKDVKVVQRTVLALGHLCYGERQLAATVVDGLFSLARSKAEDVLFAVGESLALIWGGLRGISADTFLRTNFVSLTASHNFLAADTPESTDVVMRDAGDQSDAASEAADGLHEAIRRKLLEELMVSSRKEERCAGAVWLLSLVTYSGHSAGIQKLLPEIQEAFSHLLGDSNELTQEMASRGMSLVYELADDALRQQLVSALVGTLSGSAGKKRAVKLMEESEVFTGDALGTAPGGGNLSTYKELCNMATDMGQPDMIYKFMELANYQSSLNSRRGAAFGFAKIAQLAGEALQPHLQALVPKLLRHQYDPSKAIQDSMAHIWRALVPEPKKTIDQYWIGIMEDLLKETGSRLWRSREAACLALSDLLPSRRFDEVAPYLSQIWTMAFRVADDIKESVRLAGEKLCRTVSSLSVRLCDPEMTPKKEATEACGVVLPILLNQGMLSTVSTVRKLSLSTISKLVKSAGPAVKGILPDVVAAMLEALSSLEDQTLNYAELHAERVGISSEKLESVRLSLAKDSPMWDTLDWCLRQVDAATLDNLVPRLVELTRSGVGLNTRVGIARFTTQLVQRTGTAPMKPHAAALLKVLVPAVQNEKSAAARRAFANACAEVARCAGEARMDRLIADSVARYSGEKDARLASALLLRELARNAGDVISAHSELLPLIFIARFDEDGGVRSLYEELWDESSSTTGSTLQLHLPEITARICDGIQSSSWPRKQQSAKGAVALAEAVREDIGAPNVHQLLAAFLHELPGRLWEGKESCLEAVGALCRRCGTTIVASATGAEGLGPEAITRALLAACERKKTTFREASLRCLEQVLSAFKAQDLLPLVAAPLVQILTEAALPAGAAAASSAASNGASSSGSSESAPSASSLLVPTLGSLAAALPAASPASMANHGEAVAGALATCLSGGSAWTARLAAIAAVRRFQEAAERAMAAQEVPGALVWLRSLTAALLGSTDDLKYSQIRTAALECLQEMVVSTSGRRLLEEDEELAVQLAQRLSSLAQTDKSASIRTLALAITGALQGKE